MTEIDWPVPLPRGERIIAVNNGRNWPGWRTDPWWVEWVWDRMVPAGEDGPADGPEWDALVRRYAGPLRRARAERLSWRQLARDVLGRVQALERDIAAAHKYEDELMSMLDKTRNELADLKVVKAGWQRQVEVMQRRIEALERKDP